ncbi:MAG: AraC family transcriptional regulator [Oscillospiraceae bacterium]|nr:AraC family transcriptional regulator [Oscillospiraceae bacterium]
MSTLYTYSHNNLLISHSLDEHPDTNKFSMHAHDSNEIFYFISGHGKYAVEGNMYDLYPGCIMIMRANETHKLHIEPDLPYERIVINFAPSIIMPLDPEMHLLESFLDRPNGQWNRYSPDELDFDAGKYIKGMILPKESEYNQRLAITSRLICLLYDLSTHFHKTRQKETSNTPRDMIADVVDYINTNLFGDWNLDMLSAHFYISKSYLNRIFKNSTGCSIWNYVLIKRLMVARESIRNGTPITTVYRACGFNDYSTFFRRYRNHFGVSPKDDKPR